jgi:hypothetical protein
MATIDYRDVLGKIIVGVSVPAILGLGALMASRWGNAVAYAGGSQHKAFFHTCASIFFVIVGSVMIVVFVRIAYKYLHAPPGTAKFDPWDLILLGCGLLLFIGGIMYFIDIFTYFPQQPPNRKSPRTTTPTRPTFSFRPTVSFRPNP